MWYQGCNLTITKKIRVSTPPSIHSFMKIEQIPPIAIPHQATPFCDKPISETWNRYSNIIVVERKLIKHVWSVLTYWLSISNIERL